MCTLHGTILLSVQFITAVDITNRIKLVGVALDAIPAMLLAVFCIVALADASLYGVRTPSSTRGVLGLSRRHAQPPDTLGTKSAGGSCSSHTVSVTGKRVTNANSGNGNDATDTSEISRVYNPVDYGADPTGVNDSADAFEELISDMWSAFSPIFIYYHFYSLLHQFVSIFICESESHTYKYTIDFTSLCACGFRSNLHMCL